ncbi:PREDICTED: transmembrane protein 107-like, partial [Tinamus guttatus]|uniref:transmembrane protein 107-like n=1 Tax=Tinamus guttatus TaxID=94827 RepID=UPI00052EEE2D
LLGGLGVTLGLLALELGGFFSGLSMFHRPQALALPALTELLIMGIVLGCKRKAL